MGTGDTSIGGSGRSFPDTTWGLVSQVQDPDTIAYREGLSELSRRYWKPIYYYVRLAKAKTNEEAKDLTQGFFLWLVEGRSLARFTPERGAFRGYLKVLLKGFLGHQEVAAHSLKRGGGVRIVPLEGALPSIEEISSDAGAASPESAFDRAWVEELVNIAVSRVRDRYTKEKREIQFQVFERHDRSTAAEPPTYASVAEQLGLKESVVRNYLFAVRQSLREEIRKELERVTTDLASLEEEWNELFRI